MYKYVHFGIEEGEVECDIDITYENFLCKIQTIFDLKEDSFTVVGLNEEDFDKLIITEEHFTVVRSEKDKALERLNGKICFGEIETLEEAEDFLLAYGFKSDYYYRNPFYWAVYHRQYDIIKMLLEKGFPGINNPDKDGITPFHVAVEMCNEETVELLLEKDFDNAYKEGFRSDTPLISSIIRNNTEIAKLILEKNFDNANQANNDGDIPLHFAIRGNNIEIIELLLEKKFDNEHQANNDGETPLYLALNSGRKYISELILEKSYGGTYKERDNVSLYLDDDKVMWWSIDGRHEKQYFFRD